MRPDPPQRVSPPPLQAGAARVPLEVETRASLRGFNTFGLPAFAQTLVHVRSVADVKRVVDHPSYGRAAKFIARVCSRSVIGFSNSSV